MKYLYLALCALMLISAVPAGAAAAPARGQLTHVVAFKFKKAVTDKQKKQVADAFAALPAAIPQIISLNHGTNVSKEGFNLGFTHAFVVTFANEKDRDIYLEHEAHKKFGKLLDGLLTDKGVFVIDFVSGK